MRWPVAASISQTCRGAPSKPAFSGKNTARPATLTVPSVASITSTVSGATPVRNSYMIPKASAEVATSVWPLSPK